MANPFLSSIKLPSDSGKYSMTEGGAWLDRLSHVNLFVGANNTGKSRLLRGLYQQMSKQDCVALTGLDRKEIMKRLSEGLRRALGEDFPTRGVALSEVLRNREDGWYPPQIHGIDAFLQELSRDLRSANASSREVLADFNNWFQTYQKEIELCHSEIMKVYIPPIRSVRADLTAELDAAAAKHFNGDPNGTRDLRTGTKTHGKIWSGEQMHRTIKRALLGDYSARNRVRAFETFLKEKFFNDQNVVLIPKEDSAREEDKREFITGRTLFVKVGKEEEKSILEIGDGIQQIMLLVWPLFEYAEQPLALFIEEPELYLHPGMQRKLIEILADGPNRSKQLQVFMATHSHSFLDRTLDNNKISVFRLSKSLEGSEEDDQRTATFRVARIVSPDFSILRELGVAHSSMMLANSTIWVEGISDRIYLRCWLRLYQDSLKKNSRRFSEDIHFAFMEYGGSNIVHWSFLDDLDSAKKAIATSPEARNMNAQALCAQLFLIADYDNTKEESAKYQRLTLLKQVLGSNFYVDETCREIENMLTPDCLVETLRGFDQSPVPAEAAKSEDYALEGMGSFIDNKLLAKAAKKRKFGADSGTIKNKVEFALEAIRHMNKWGDLSDKAKSLTERVYQFIADHNKM